MTIDEIKALDGYELLTKLGDFYQKLYETPDSETVDEEANNTYDLLVKEYISRHGIERWNGIYKSLLQKSDGEPTEDDPFGEAAAKVEEWDSEDRKKSNRRGYLFKRIMNVMHVVLLGIFAMWLYYAVSKLETAVILLEQLHRLNQ